MLKNFSKIFLTILLSLFLSSASLAGSLDWQNHSKKVQTRLLTSTFNDDGQKKLILGVHFLIEKGWKVYGKDSEGIGMPPSFDFKGSKNITDHKIIWPTAELSEEKIGNTIFRYYYYNNEVIIPVEINLIDAQQDSDIKLNFDFAICKETCIPVNVKYEFKVNSNIDYDILATIQPYSSKSLGLEENNYKFVVKNHQYDIKTLLITLVFALIGGAILNIMPCVLPVISIKLTSLVKYSQLTNKQIRFAFLATLIGIVSCFFIFAILASIIKITGNSVGWGLQFQNPYFLIFLMVVLVFFTSELLGIFDIQFSQNIINFFYSKILKKEAEKNIFIPNFLSGILAVLLATPCSAPFLGSAITFALTQDFLAILLIFLTIGLGFGFPYIALIFAPNLVHKLPKTAEWNLKVKKIMAGFLIATTIWLSYVLMNNIGYLPGLIAIIIAVSFYKILQFKEKIIRHISIIIALILIFNVPFNIQKKQFTQTIIQNLYWKEFKEEDIAKYLSNDKIILVDITADWCITCKFNKIRVLESKEITNLLESGEVIGLRGDITKPNEKIMDFLHKNNRYAIPFNIVYGPNAKEGIATSELLTKKELFTAIKKAQGEIK